MIKNSKLLIDWNISDNDIFHNMNHVDEIDTQPTIMDKAGVELLIKKIGRCSFPIIHFKFGGGVPLLLGLGYFEKITGFQKQYLYEKEYTNIFQINSALINEEIISFAKSNRFGFSILIDEVQIVHRTNDIFQSELKFPDIIFEKMQLLTKNDMKYELVMTCNDVMIPKIDGVYQFFKSLEGLASVDLIIPNPSSQSLMTKGGLSKIINGLFDHWFNDSDCKFDIKILTTLVLSMIGLPQPNCILTENCMREATTLVIVPSGNVYPCNRRVVRENLLGNIAFDEIDHLILNNFEREKQNRLDLKMIQSCRFCQWYLSCHGGCPVHFNQRTRQNEYCGELQSIFGHIKAVLKERVIMDDDENIFINDDNSIANQGLKKAIVGFYF